ncbi:MAG: outer membrane lipoprotein-sorting protein [Nitrospinota bacterium]|nr:outer membrane lipoprotein-sorting protein [Nitrospinota bacterium]
MPKRIIRSAARGLTAAILTVALSAGAMAHAETPQEKATRILERVDDMWRGKSSRAVFSMEVRTKRYKRKLSLEAWSKGKDLSLVIIKAPVKERGTATLKSGTSIYTYLPKTDRTIRLTSGMMMGSWMGSHFTNDDLVKESRMSDDYDVSIAFDGERDGQQIYEFELIPKPDAAVVWGKITMAVRKDDLMPIVSTYFDEDMERMRTMAFSDIKTMGGRKFPATLRVTPEDKPDEYTEVVYHKMEFDISLSDNLFSISSLKRSR